MVLQSLKWFVKIRNKTKKEEFFNLYNIKTLNFIYFLFLRVKLMDV